MAVPSLLIRQIALPKNFITEISRYKLLARSWEHAVYPRQTIDFGKVFSALEEGRIEERPFPQSILQIRQTLFHVFQKAISEPQSSAEDYDNCIVTWYAKGEGISPHTDRNLRWASLKEERRFYFGNSILGLIVQPDVEQSLYFEDPQAPQSTRFYLPEVQGTAFLFQDTLRQEWQHGLLPVHATRISMTFRRVVEKSFL